MSAGSLEPCLVVAAYFEVNVGLNHTNCSLLSTVAQWQEAYQTPAIIGADFNLSPRTLSDSNFITRSGLLPIVASDATYRTAKTASILDYFLMAAPFAERVTTVRVLKDFPVRPPSPVLCTLEVSPDGKVPALDVPPRLPLHAPFGPSLPHRDWRTLSGRIDAALAYCDGEHSQREKQQMLDEVYVHFVAELEQQVCERTDTPRRRRSRRGRAPRIRWIDVTTRCQEHRASWRTLVRPLQWIQSWTQDVLRYLSGTSPDTSSPLLQQDPDDCPG